MATQTGPTDHLLGCHTWSCFPILNAEKQYSHDYVIHVVNHCVYKWQNSG